MHASRGGCSAQPNGIGNDTPQDSKWMKGEKELAVPILRPARDIPYMYSVQSMWGKRHGGRRKVPTAGQSALHTSD